MKFTILGAGGYIGRALCENLRRQGFEVFAPLREDPRIWTEPLGHVIYAIGLTANFRTRPFDTVEAHVSLLARVLRDACFESLLYLSSTRVYSDAVATSEDSTLQVNPNVSGDLYNLSKLLGESLCFNCGHALVRVARLSNVIGGENPGSTLFFYALLTEARAGLIRLQSDPENAKDYITLGDAVHLLQTIAMQGRQRLYNVASGNNVSNRELVEEMRRLTGCQVMYSQGGESAAFMPIDICRISHEFGFRAAPVLAELPALLKEE